MLEMNLGSQSLRAKETSEAAEAKESPGLQPQSRVILGTNVLTKSQTINVHMRNLEAPGTSKSVLFPRMSVFQDSGKPCLNTIVVSELKSKLKVQSENQSQDCPTHMLPDRKSTRLNSSHANISYAVFCLKKKKVMQ